MSNCLFSTLRTSFFTAGLFLATVGMAHADSAPTGVNTGYFGNVAIKGYDPVAYFTQGKAVPGDPNISTIWLGAKWQFATAEDRRLFIKNPIAYAPQYGGHCADGMAYVATAVTVNIDPTAWSVIDGKLYLSYDPGSAKDFADGAGLVGKADANWRSYRASNAAQ